jgi:hypothetical protein
MAKRTPKRIVEESIRSNTALNADADGIRLYDMARELKITPVQAVARYFCHGKGHYKVRRDYEGLLKILTLLGECDWEYDPAVKVNDGCDIRDVNERWVVWDRDNLNTATTEIRCTEDVVERFLKPLLGETFNVASFMQRLIEQGPTAEAVEEVERAITQREAAEHHATTALELDGTFAEAGDNQYTRPSGLDKIKTTEQGDGGTSAAYLAARLKKAGRDDLLEQIGPGKPHRSVRSAAIEAGIIKPVPTIRLVEDVGKVAAAIARHLSHEQLHALVSQLSQQLETAANDTPPNC